MLTSFKRLWWVFLLRAIVAIVFGILAIVFPGLTILTLATLFGVYSLFDGISSVVVSFSSRLQDSQWWVHLIEGIVGVIVGILVLTYPDIAALALIFMIAAWAVITGIIEVIAAIHLRKEIENELWLGLGGLISIVFGVIIFRFPMAGVQAIGVVVGIYAIVFGAIFGMLAFRIRNYTKATQSGA